MYVYMRRMSFRMMLGLLVAAALVFGIMQPSSVATASTTPTAVTNVAESASMPTASAAPAKKLKKAGVVRASKAPKAPKGCRVKGQRTIVLQVDTDIPFGVPYRGDLAAEAWYCATASRKHPSTITMRYALVRGANAASAHVITGLRQFGMSYSNGASNLKWRKAVARDGKWLRINGKRGLRLKGCTYSHPCSVVVAWYNRLAGDLLLGMWAAARVRAPLAT